MTILHRHRVLIVLVIAAVLLNFLSRKDTWVEKYYTFGVYPHIARGLRGLFGWIPFSIGDFLYVGAGVFVLYYAAQIVRRLLRGGMPGSYLRGGGEKLLKGLLVVYLLFNALWGLNYNRVGVAPQVGVQVSPYNKADLQKLVHVLQERICFNGDRVNAARRFRLNQGTDLLDAIVAAYTAAEPRFPYFAYSIPSVKPSLLSPLGPYFGFTGYYNPFTAEAQVNSAVPFFIKPFVMGHEIAHQLGYAKESEANFVSYLVLRAAADPELRYSVYFEMHAYALSELRQRDPLQAWLFAKTVHPQYNSDYADYIDYLAAHRNRVEPIISKFYDRYLKLNNQPSGKATYNLVVAWLVGYMNKFGEASL